jgi:hypothetical protein
MGIPDLVGRADLGSAHTSALIPVEHLILRAEVDKRASALAGVWIEYVRRRTGHQDGAHTATGAGGPKKGGGAGGRLDAGVATTGSRIKDVTRSAVDNCVAHASAVVIVPVFASRALVQLDAGAEASGRVEIPGSLACRGRKVIHRLNWLVWLQLISVRGALGDECRQDQGQSEVVQYERFHYTLVSKIVASLPN